MSFPYVDVEQTFGDFLEEFGAEVSDRTLSGSNKPTNADYIFHDEKVIAELKLLKKDPFENKDFKKSFVNKQREWLQKGYITLTQLRSITKIRQLPDKCYNDMVKLYRSPIKTHIDKANDQIKKTKARLNVPDYKGLLFLGSDGNYFLEPDNVRQFVADLLNNSSRYRSINTVVYLTINVVTTHPNDSSLSRLWVKLYRDEDVFENVSLSFLNKLYDEWVEY